jgi:hypothetical protein
LHSRRLGGHPRAAIAQLLLHFGADRLFGEALLFFECRQQRPVIRGGIFDRRGSGPSNGRKQYHYDNTACAGGEKSTDFWATAKHHGNSPDCNEWAYRNEMKSRERPRAYFQ